MVVGVNGVILMSIFMAIMDNSNFTNQKDILPSFAGDSQ
jgi:hypothetical protein